MLVVGRRHELGLAHGAGPGADHALAGDVAVLQDLQGGQQLDTPEALASPVIGQCRQGADHAVAADIVAEVAFQAPDGHQYPRVDTVLLLYALQDQVVLRQQDAAATNAARGHCTIEILPHRAGELRLAAVGLEYRRVGRDVREHPIEQGRIDAGGQRFAAQCLAPVGEARNQAFAAGLSGARGEGGREIFGWSLSAGGQ